jgi:hypothetical protein
MIFILSDHGKIDAFENRYRYLYLTLLPLPTVDHHSFCHDNLNGSMIGTTLAREHSRKHVRNITSRVVEFSITAKRFFLAVSTKKRKVSMYHNNVYREECNTGAKKWFVGDQVFHIAKEANLRDPSLSPSILIVFVTLLLLWSRL